jgi:hypothetical protein
MSIESILGTLFCLVLAIGMFYAFINWGKDNKVIESWPKTNGKILEKDIIGKHLVLKYEYYVNGVRHVSGNIFRYGISYGAPIKWGKFEDINNLEFVKNPEVKYNPENPTDCCLVLFYDKLWLKIVVFISGLVFSLITLIRLLMLLSNV